MKLKHISSAILSTALAISGSVGLNAIVIVSPIVAPAQAQPNAVSTLRGCFLNEPFDASIAFTPTNIRQQPTTDSPALPNKLSNTGRSMRFSGINLGKAVNDAWDGQPDNMWYRIDGQGWVASAVVKGYPHRGDCTTTSNGGGGGTTTPSAQKIIDAVNRVNPNVNYRFDGKYTYCNWFAADVLKLLGVEVPRVSGTETWHYYNSVVFGYGIKPWQAENLYGYFSAGGNGKWRSVDAATAVSRANQGGVVVASAGSPPGGGDGHIAIVIPGGSGANVRIAQAGLRNGSSMAVTEGFGSRTPRYFEYIGPR
jgi:hypothetical protein